MNNEKGEIGADDKPARRTREGGILEGFFSAVNSHEAVTSVSNMGRQPNVRCDAWMAWREI